MLRWGVIEAEFRSGSLPEGRPAVVVEVLILGGMLWRFGWLRPWWLTIGTGALASALLFLGLPSVIALTVMAALWLSWLRHGRRRPNTAQVGGLMAASVGGLAIPWILNAMTTGVFRALFDTVGAPWMAYVASAVEDCGAVLASLPLVLLWRYARQPSVVVVAQSAVARSRTAIGSERAKAPRPPPIAAIVVAVILGGINLLWAAASLFTITTGAIRGDQAALFSAFPVLKVMSLLSGSASVVGCSALIAGAWLTYVNHPNGRKVMNIACRALMGTAFFFSTMSIWGVTDSGAWSRLDSATAAGLAGGLVGATIGALLMYGLVLFLLRRAKARSKWEDLAEG